MHDVAEGFFILSQRDQDKVGTTLSTLASTNSPTLSNMAWEMGSSYTERLDTFHKVVL